MNPTYPPAWVMLSPRNTTRRPASASASPAGSGAAATTPTAIARAKRIMRRLRGPRGATTGKHECIPAAPGPAGRSPGRPVPSPGRRPDDRSRWSSSRAPDRLPRLLPGPAPDRCRRGRPAPGSSGAGRGACQGPAAGRWRKGAGAGRRLGQGVRGYPGRRHRAGRVPRKDDRSDLRGHDRRRAPGHRPAAPGPSSRTRRWTRRSRSAEIDGREAFAIRTDAARVRLIGATDLGASHAAFRFLEALGCRWFFPAREWEVVPSAPTLRANVNETVRPALLARRIWYGYGFFHEPGTAAGQTPPLRNYKAWARHNRMASSLAVNAGHAWQTIIADNKAAFDQHPEYRALVGGQRRGEQLCVSNPEVRVLATRWALDYLKKHPQADMVSMEPSDGDGQCECDQCKKLGTVSDRAFGLANEVARAVAKEYPGKMVGILAYSQHCEPPSVRPGAERPRPAHGRVRPRPVPVRRAARTVAEEVAEPRVLRILVGLAVGLRPAARRQRRRTSRTCGRRSPGTSNHRGGQPGLRERGQLGCPRPRVLPGQQADVGPEGRRGRDPGRLLREGLRPGRRPDEALLRAVRPGNQSRS